MVETGGRRAVAVVLRRGGPVAVVSRVARGRGIVATSARLGVVPRAVVVAGIGRAVCAGRWPGVVAAVAVAVATAVAVVGALGGGERLVVVVGAGRRGSRGAGRLAAVQQRGGLVVVSMMLRLRRVGMEARTCSGSACAGSLSGLNLEL